MQGFRAAEFVGIDPLTKPAAGFIPLRERGIGIKELAELWQIPKIQQHLLHEAAGTPFSNTLRVLRTCDGKLGQSLADAFDAFPFRKGHWTVRAYLQNSAVLARINYSFRDWLQCQCAELGETEFPPPDFRKRDKRVRRLQRGLVSSRIRAEVRTRHHPQR
jgi:hypothetical protein